MPRIAMTKREVANFLQTDFANTVTGIINRLIGTELVGWNMDFLVGETPFHMVSVGYKINLAELWHNTGHSFAFLERGLLVTRDRTNLFNRMAVRVGMLWGIYGEMLWRGAFSREDFPDVVFSEMDLPMLPSAWYAREMGLPIGNIICCCDEDSMLWELFSHGTLHLGRGKTVSEEIVFLLDQVVGGDVNVRLQAAKEFGGVFSLTAEELGRLQKGISICVVSQSRMGQLMALLKGKGYAATEEGAAAYGALQYFRAANRTSAPAMVLLEKPRLFLDF